MDESIQTNTTHVNEPIEWFNLFTWSLLCCPVYLACCHQRFYSLFNRCCNRDSGNRDPLRNTNRNKTKSKISLINYDQDSCVSECTICLNEFTEKEKIIRLPCYHCYHLSCIQSWFKINRSCPTCRLEI